MFSWFSFEAYLFWIFDFLSIRQAFLSKSYSYWKIIWPFVLIATSFFTVYGYTWRFFSLIFSLSFSVKSRYVISKILTRRSNFFKWDLNSSSNIWSLTKSYFLSTYCGALKMFLIACKKLFWTGSSPEKTGSILYLIKCIRIWNYWISLAPARAYSFSISTSLLSKVLE